MVSSSVTISMFTSLSSATSTRSPSREGASCFSGSGGTASGRAAAKGSTRVNTVPSPGWLWTEISPSIWATRLLVMAMPRPVPPAWAALNRSSLA